MKIENLEIKESEGVINLNGKIYRAESGKAGEVIICGHSGGRLTKDNGDTICVCCGKVLSTNQPATVEQVDILFTTNDGVDIRKGDEYFILCPNKAIHRVIACGNKKAYYGGGFPPFGTEQAAKDYINPPATVQQVWHKWASEFEILSFKNGYDEYVISSQGNYELNHDAIYYTQSWLLTTAKIHSIKRKSDQAVFTVGDKVNVPTRDTYFKIDKITIEGDCLFVHNFAFKYVANVCHPYTDPALPTLQEVFKKVQPRWYLTSENRVVSEDKDFEGSHIVRNHLSTESQCKQLQAYIALRNIADYYNGEVGWMPKQGGVVYCIVFDLIGAVTVDTLDFSGIDFISPLIVPFKQREHAENAIAILKEAGLLEALKG